MKTMWLAGVALGASLALAGAASAQDITIGVAGPMTGQYASFGTQLKNGADAAVADINAAGGVMGKKLKLEIGDDACDPKQARAVGEKFASMKVPFVAGHYCSSSSIPASEAYQDGNVLQITPASTNPTFTDRNMWNTFRVCGRDDQQGSVAGEYVAKNFGPPADYFYAVAGAPYVSLGKDETDPTSKLSFANRSDLVIEPTLICPAPDATARSARNESSVSPDRAETTARHPARAAKSSTWKVSVKVPI